MRSVCLVGGFGSSLFGFTKLGSPLTKPATTPARSELAIILGYRKYAGYATWFVYYLSCSLSIYTV